MQGAVQSASWNGELVTVPFWANTQLLWYRKSVAEAAGLDMSQPVTWDQIIQAAQDQNKQLGVQGALAESLTVWINALVASAGGQILDNPDARPDEMQLGLETDAGRKAADIIGRIGSSGLGGSGLPTADENASMNLFQGDNGSFMVNWPFVYPAMQAAAPDVVDDLGWAVYPRVDADTPPPLPSEASISASVRTARTSTWPGRRSRASSAPRTRRSTSSPTATPPSNLAAYDDAEVNEKFPMASTIAESLQLGAPVRRRRTTTRSPSDCSARGIRRTR